MIEYKCNKGKVNLFAEGDVRELVSDITLLINRIYNVMMKDSLESADTFKTLCRHSLVALPFISDYEMLKEEKEKGDKIHDDDVEKLSRLTEKLKSLKEILCDINDIKKEGN